MLLKSVSAEKDLKQGILKTSAVSIPLRNVPLGRRGNDIVGRWTDASLPVGIPIILVLFLTWI